MLFACLVVMAEYGIVKLYDALPFEGAEDVRLIHRLTKLKDPQSYDVLILGDSSATNGIDPQIIERVIGLSAYNLATYRNVTAYADTTLLERYLRYHQPPKIIIVGRSIHMWHQVQARETVYEYFFSPRTMHDALTDYPLALEERLTIYISQLWPSFRLAYSLKHRLFGVQKDMAADFSAFERHNGFVPTFGRIKEGSRIEALQKNAGSMPFENTSLLQSICNLAVEHRIHLIFVTTPHAPSIGFDATNDPFPAYYNEFISESLRSVSPEYCHYLTNTPFADAVHLSDPIHLNATGSTLFTTQLANRLLPFLSESGSVIQMKGQ